MGCDFCLKQDNLKQEQLEVLRQEVSKGFEQLAAGETSSRSVMDIFEQASSSTK